MLKVVHIARPLAGVGVYISLLVKNIDPIKFKNYIICNKNEDIIDIRDHNKDKVKTYHANIIRNISLLNDVKTTIKIIKLLKEIKPDIIHCHSAKAGILGRIAGSFLGVKTFYTPHAYSYLSTTNLIKKNIFKNIEKFLGYFSSKTIACSESEYNRTILDLKLLKKKVFLWRNSINDISQNNSVSLKSKTYDLCANGRPSYQKNTELLLESLLKVRKRIPNIQLVILGVGHYSPNLNRLNEIIEKEKLKKNVTLVPWLERDKSLQILRNTKIYVSTSRYEGLSYAALEALSLSKPCILTNVDGNNEIVYKGKNGFLVDEDSCLISEKIIKLLEDDNLLLKMGEQSRKYFKNNFNIETNINELENLYLF
jgi:glycosyltransferase involved in cell wall biosynthesis